MSSQRKTQTPIEDQFTVLGVSWDSSDAEIKQAYRRLAKKHNDANGDEPDEERMKQINLAREELEHPNQRSAHREELEKQAEDQREREEKQRRRSEGATDPVTATNIADAIRGNPTTTTPKQPRHQQPSHPPFAPPSGAFPGNAQAQSGSSLPHVSPEPNTRKAKASISSATSDAIAGVIATGLCLPVWYGFWAEGLSGFRFWWNPVAVVPVVVWVFYAIGVVLNVLADLRS